MPSHLGEAWDEFDLGEVVAILISYSSFTITSLRFLYVKNNVFQMSKQYGRLEGSSRMVCISSYYLKTYHCWIGILKFCFSFGYMYMQIMLDYPTEFLTAVHGYRNSTNVTSLTFVTNKATYGPLGKDYSKSPLSDYSFDLPLGSEVGWFKGFHGTVYNGYIGSIGVYMTPVITQSQSSSGQMKLEYE